MKKKVPNGIWIAFNVAEIDTFGVCQVQDAIPSSIGFCTSEGPISTLPSNVLFQRGHPLPSVKVVTLHKNSKFKLDAFYVDENELSPGTSTKIGAFQVCYLLSLSDKRMITLYAYNLLIWISIVLYLGLCICYF